MGGFQIELSPQQLLRKSREIAGIDHYDSDIEEALTRLVAALNAEAQLSQTGAENMQQRILTILCNRLRMQRDFEQHPQIAEQKIIRPFILTGAGRSGSTKLHKLLAASGDFKYLKFWQQYNFATRTGDRNENPSQRIAEAADFIAWFDRQVPDAKRIHAYETHAPEEETFLFDHAKFMINFNITHASIPSYTEWVMAQDMVAQLEFVKRAIKYLQWQFFPDDPRPWVLKNPVYAGIEPLLAQVFPGAALIATHRDPAKRVASSAGLMTHFKKAYSDVDRTAEAGPAMLALMAHMAEQYVMGRDKNPGVTVLDISYSQLVSAPEGVVEKVYEFAGRPFSLKIRAAVNKWEMENRQHKHGVYKYQLADYGMSKKMVEDRFKMYTERFGDYF